MLSCLKLGRKCHIRKIRLLMGANPVLIYALTTLVRNSATPRMPSVCLESTVLITFPYSWSISGQGSFASSEEVAACVCLATDSSKVQPLVFLFRNCFIMQYPTVRDNCGGEEIIALQMMFASPSHNQILLDAIPNTLSDTSFHGLAYLLPYSAPGCSQQRSAVCSPRAHCKLDLI